MTRQPYGGLTDEELCDLLMQSYSEVDTMWAAVEKIKRIACAARDPADPRSNCAFKHCQGVVSDNKCEIPTDIFELPDCPASVELVIRRQRYIPNDTDITGDFTLNWADNTLELNPTLGLNGQTFYARIWAGTT